MTFYSELINWIIETKPDMEKLAQKKRSLSKKYGRKNPPTNIQILLNADAEDVPAIKPYILTKPMRTGSGVAVVATMTKPGVCPHGSCIYCPGGVGSHFGDTPKSYTGNEPSTMRGIRNDYDAYRIVFNRLMQYIITGHHPDKVEQIVMGGTFPAFPSEYQEQYITDSFQGYNDFSTMFYKKGEVDLEKFKDFFELPGELNDIERESKVRDKVLALKNSRKTILESEQVTNESATIRCIGLTIETKPDWGFKEHGLEFLRFGATRVELGIQTVYDDVLMKVHRGHDLEASKKSIADLRDLGFKLNFHMMPGLPGKDGKRLSREKDIASLKVIFEDEAFMPDMLKIYPTLVMPGTVLERAYKAGKFVPLTTAEAADIIVEAKKYVPEWCRVMRIQRDIPTYATTAGVDRTNLRQYVSELCKKRGVKCRCIRCREVGRTEIKSGPSIVVTEYRASGGKEFFISMEADDMVLGFVRLRFPPRSLHPAITSDSALVRELHVYGTAVRIGKESEDKTQHRGIGRTLMAKAEEIVVSAGKTKVVVISGVGVRGYYRKLGYEREGPYMVKKV